MAGVAKDFKVLRRWSKAGSNPVTPAKLFHMKEDCKDCINYSERLICIYGYMGPQICNSFTPKVPCVGKENCLGAIAFGELVCTDCNKIKTKDI